MEEVSLTIDEAKLRKMADEMLRQRCTSGDEPKIVARRANDCIVSIYRPITRNLQECIDGQYLLIRMARKRDCNESDDGSRSKKPRVKASSIVHPDPNEPVRVEFIFNGRTFYLTEQEIQDYWDKEEQIKKAEEEARLNAISKHEVIKVIREEAKKLGIHLKEAITTKVGELFKKA
ncbi:hypothetical protein Tco_1134787 [Tanacetum coccineum]